MTTIVLPPTAAPPKRRTGGAVKVYRREFRDDEMPDIRLSRADVLRPLMALALRDDALASCLLEQIAGQLYERRTKPSRRRA